MTKSLKKSSGADQPLTTQGAMSVDIGHGDIPPQAEGGQRASMSMAWRAFLAIRAEIGPLSDEECLVDRPLNTSSAVRDPFASTYDSDDMGR